MIELVHSVLATAANVHATTAHFTTAAATTGLNTNVGSTGVNAGAGHLQGTSNFTGGLQKVVNTVSEVGGPFALLGTLWGGVVHTHVFHNERAPEQGKNIMKNSLFGLGVLVFAPLLTSAVTHL